MTNINEISDSKAELKKMLLALTIPCYFIFICWIFYLIEVGLSISLSNYGLRPREIRQWYGILTMPFLHGGIQHLAANSVSFIVLGSMVFYFYNKIAIKIFILTYLFSGILTWIIGRSSIHIGASAMIYAFAGFLFTSGVISKNIRLLAISLIVVFLYGSMIWGIFPLNDGVSWEGHLSGLIVGIVLSLIYTPRPEKVVYDDDDDDDDEFYGESEYLSSTKDDHIKIKYIYREDE